MTKVSRILIGCCLSVGAFGSAAADTLDTLQGAWTADGTDCAQTFKKSGDKIDFIDRNSSLSTGMIIAGKTIEGSNSTCTIVRIVEQDGAFNAHLNCADAIMLSEMSASFKIIDSTHIQRFDSTFPEIAADYQKCSF